MEEFTIYCTEEQTKKALELGALIINGKYYHKICKIGEVEYATPTAEQMLGWFRSKGLRFKIAEYTNSTFWQYHIESSFKCGSELCYRDAVLSLIDAALDYIADNNLIK